MRSNYSRHPETLIKLLTLCRTISQTEWYHRGFQNVKLRASIPVTDTDPFAPWWWEHHYNLTQEEWYMVLHHCPLPPFIILQNL